MDIYTSVGVSGICNKEEVVEAAKKAIRDYKKNNKIDTYNSILVIFITYADLSLAVVNDAFNLIESQLSCNEMSWVIKEMKSDEMVDKMEIIIVGE